MTVEERDGFPWARVDLKPEVCATEHENGKWAMTVISTQVDAYGVKMLYQCPECHACRITWVTWDKV